MRIVSHQDRVASRGATYTSARGPIDAAHAVGPPAEQSPGPRDDQAADDLGAGDDRREVGTTGDGFLALFDGAVRAARCAESMISAVADLDIQIRAGLHSGEVVIAGGQARGLAVHAAARVAALAGPGEVLVSSTTRDLLDGSGLAFTARGDHQLKGLAGARTIYALEASGSSSPR
ncbi:MAG: adenylate/guanylate cyclase domain-containing protein [Candidatus Limnocylindrales bacterium]